MTRAIAVTGLLLAVGCSASSSTTPVGADAAGEALDGDSTDGGTASDGCNSIVQVGAPVHATCEPGTAPAAQGGTIVDGIYFLTDSRFFGDCPSSDLAETLVVSQGTVQSLVTTATGETLRKSLRYEVTGTMMLQTQTCPVAVLTRGSFTATPTTLTMVLTNGPTTRASTFTHL